MTIKDSYIEDRVLKRAAQSSSTTRVKGIAKVRPEFFVSWRLPQIGAYDEPQPKKEQKAEEGVKPSGGKGAADEDSPMTEAVAGAAGAEQQSAISSSGSSSCGTNANPPADSSTSGTSPNPPAEITNQGVVDSQATTTASATAKRPVPEDGAGNAPEGLQQDARPKKRSKAGRRRDKQNARRQKRGGFAGRPQWDNLCGKIAMGGECTFEKEGRPCKFSHDIEAYMRGRPGFVSFFFFAMSKQGVSWR